MDEFTLKLEEATPENVAPFGQLLAAREGVPPFASWSGVDVFGEIPIEVATGGGLLVVRMAAHSFPLKVGLIERHFKHTQVYLPFNGKPFVMVLGNQTIGHLPDFSRLRAFLFKDVAGIALHKEIWHVFPHALEDDTQFAVVLSNESHINNLKTPEFPMDAEGPDLERRAVTPRATVIVTR